MTFLYVNVCMYENIYMLVNSVLASNFTMTVKTSQDLAVNAPRQ